MRGSFFKGVFFIVISFFCAALMNAFGKAILDSLHVLEILFFQNFFAAFLLIPNWIFNQEPLFRTRRLPLHFLRALTGILFYLCFFVSVKYISLLNATLLSNATPLFLPFITWFWLKKKISLSLWVSLIIGFLGVVFVLGPSIDLFSSIMVLVALLGSLFSAVALQAVRELRSSESSFSIIFFYFLLSMIVMAPFLPFIWKQPTFYEWVFLFLIGLMLVLTQLFLTYAYRYSTPVQLGPFNYSIVIFAGLIGWIVWDQSPRPIGYLGIALISLGGIFSLRNQEPRL